MTYELKGGEHVKDGKLYGWTGKVCKRCNGHGEYEGANGRNACPGCGGTGEQHGLMPIQPADLGPDTE
jgi:DnaJ-class molecular chaperone